MIVAGSAVGADPAAAGAQAAAGAPNIVLILTDDQRWDTLWAMPDVQRDIVDPGVTFENGFVVNPLCCPSRASILTGQYSHTTGVYTNKNTQPYGGFRAFKDGTTIATALQAAGYRTALMGKYLNGYSGTYVPPGWDRWFATYGGGGYYGYTATDDGAIESFGSDPASYGTDVLADRAVSFIEGTDPGQPLFLYFAPRAPHKPATPAPTDLDSFSTLDPWRPPSYNEADVSDKPTYIRSTPQLTTSVMAGIDGFRTNQYRTLLAVDRAVDRITTALADTGRLSNTMIVFASDNGLLWGEHRLSHKSVPYEEAIRVPFVVRYDPIVAPPRTDDHLVLNIDLAPTFASLGGATLPAVDGQSLLPLLSSPGVGWRNDFLVEHLYLGSASRFPPTFCAVRDDRYILVVYGTGERELYDLSTDPYELGNVAGTPEYAGVEAVLYVRLQALCDPPPPGFAFPTS